MPLFSGAMRLPSVCRGIWEMGCLGWADWRIGGFEFEQSLEEGAYRIETLRENYKCAV